jgi:hypothetical protein
LGTLLQWAFSKIITGAPDEALGDILPILEDRVGVVEPAWKPAIAALRGVPATALRSELTKALQILRTLARDVAQGESTATIPIKRLSLSLSDHHADRDGRPQWRLAGGLADALIWVAMRLFSEVPRSLIRRCSLEGCSRIYVASKNQKFCGAHQVEGARLTQRRAEQAFRARAKKGKKR